MVRWKPRSCPRCGGDIFLDRELDGWSEHCLQCSFRRELKNLDEFNKQPVAAGGTGAKQGDIPRN